jgi:acetylornithine deacetylase/succinyl-diaminopimelate desuccinylase-like protein
VHETNTAFDTSRGTPVRQTRPHRGHGADQTDCQKTFSGLFRSRALDRVDHRSTEKRTQGNHHEQRVHGVAQRLPAQHVRHHALGGHGVCGLFQPLCRRIENLYCSNSGGDSVHDRHKTSTYPVVEPTNTYLWCQTRFVTAIDPLRTTVQDLMPELIEDLRHLVSIPSCAFPGYPDEPVRKAAETVRDLLQKAGVTNARLAEIEGGQPVVMGELAGPEGAPVVLLYAHYDVQPAPPEQHWDTDPWNAVTKHDGRIYGRGAADDKSGIVSHLGTIRAFGGEPPVTFRFLFEGEEEIGSVHFEDFVRQHKDFVQADAVIICDSGNQQVGQPAITTALRGLAACTVTIRTLDRAGHSGMFGGAAPDALLALIKLLATLHDDDGNVAVEGLHQFEWQGAEMDESQFRVDAGIIGDDLALAGTGSLASRLWSKPSITIIGMDVPPIAGTPNALVPEASAKVSLRVAPGADSDAELQALMTHLRARAPHGMDIDISPLESGPAYLGGETGEVGTLAFEALSEAYGAPAEAMGSGGSIPAVALFTELCPTVTPVLWGPEDMAKARIHAANESVDPSEIEHIVLAQVLFASKLANR